MARKKFNFNVFRKPKEAKLNAVKFGLAGGITTAICVLFTSLLVWINYAPMWVALITDIYGSFGYDATTFFGTVLGVIYSFIDGFLLTWIFALIYNKLL